MTAPNPEFVGTDLGPLHVRRAGTGSPAVLWHSLFIDSRSWGPLFDGLAVDRAVVAIDGPSHGRSAGVFRDFTFAEVAGAAVQVLDGLGITDSVDWVGNAWGGHVGIQVAVRRPDRIRTLTTIGTPVRGLSARERWLMCWPLVQLYRLAGPKPVLSKALSNALIGPESVAAQPERSVDVISAFTSADRGGMWHAMRSMMLARPDMADDVKRVEVPTLMLAARDDAMGWQPADATSVAATMPDARVGVVAGVGHATPLLIDTETTHRAIAEFWQSVSAPS